MINWIIDNKEWFLSGLGVSVLASMKWIIKLFSHSKDSNKDSTSNVINQTINIENKDIVDNASNSFVSGHSLDKDNIFILFIDDEKLGVVNILKNGGWKNTKLIKDIKDLDDADLRSAHIVFVDINGVGIALQFKNQGIGLASAIKSKYPHKKVVIYSGESNGDRFDRDLRKVDDVIKKNAEPIEFMNIIEGFIDELNA